MVQVSLCRNTIYIGFIVNYELGTYYLLTGGCVPVLVSAGAGTHCGALWTSGGGDLGTSLYTGPGLAPRTHGRILVRMQASIFDI